MKLGEWARGYEGTGCVSVCVAESRFTASPNSEVDVDVDVPFLIRDPCIHSNFVSNL